MNSDIATRPLTGAPDLACASEFADEHHNGASQARLRDWCNRIALIRDRYLTACGRTPNLFQPVLFTEKINWRKLFDANPVYTILSDKLAVRGFAERRGFGHLLVPLLAAGRNPDAFPFASLKRPFVIKSTHASGHVIIVKTDAELDLPVILARTRAWLAHDYGAALIEPGYVRVPRRLIVERLVTAPDGGFPMEYKMFVFDGQVRLVLPVEVPEDRTRHHAFYRLPWERTAWRCSGPPIERALPPPAHLEGMIAAAESLAAGFDHLRVDFLHCGDRYFLGEITVYSFSGMENISPVEGDLEIGAFWHIRRPLLRALNAIYATEWNNPA